MKVKNKRILHSLHFEYIIEDHHSIPLSSHRQMMSITLLVVPSYHVYHPVISESNVFFCHTIVVLRRGRRFIPCTTPKHDNFKPLVIMDSFNFIVSIHSYGFLIGKCEMLSQFLMIFNTDIEWILVLKNGTSSIVWNQV